VDGTCLACVSKWATAAPFERRMRWRSMSKHAPPSMTALKVSRYDLSGDVTLVCKGAMVKFSKNFFFSFLFSFFSLAKI
jgi:hypothetical protein